MFLVSFTILLVLTAKGIIFIPVYTLFVGVATGFLIVIPCGWLYAISNFQVQLGTTNELLYGAMVQASNGNRNPTGASIYGAIAGDAWYRAQYMLQDQRIGHYTHTPQRAIFFSQIFGIVLGVPINYAALRWILDTKFDYLTGNLEDPAHIWTGQRYADSTEYIFLSLTNAP